MRKFNVNVNGNTYVVEVEEVGAGVVAGGAIGRLYTQPPNNRGKVKQISNKRYLFSLFIGNLHT